MYSMAVSARAGARARARVCGRSEWSALIFSDIAMSMIDDRSVSVTSLMPDWVTNLSLIEANSIREKLS